MTRADCIRRNNCLQLPHLLARLRCFSPVWLELMMFSLFYNGNLCFTMDPSVDVSSPERDRNAIFSKPDPHFSWKKNLIKVYSLYFDYRIISVPFRTRITKLIVFEIDYECHGLL